MSHPVNDQLLDQFREWLEERGAKPEDIDKKAGMIYVKSRWGGFYEKVPRQFLPFL